MAWRSPRFAFVHALRDAVEDISVSSALQPSPAADADFPVDFLQDDRAGALFKFGSATTDPSLVIVREASGRESIDRLLIPPGHNLDGLDLTLEADTVVGFTSPTSLLSSVAVSSGWIDESFTSNAEQYVRLTIEGVAITPELGELILTETRETVVGIDPEPGWTDRLRHNVASSEKESGAVALLARGADRRELILTYRDVRDAADRALFDELAAYAGTFRPLIVDPPYLSEAAVWMRLEEDMDAEEDTPAPKNETVRHTRYRMRLIEVVG